MTRLRFFVPSFAALIAVLADAAGGQCPPQEVGTLAALDGASLGATVSADGDTVVAGAYHDLAFAGSAYVFERDFGGLGTWGQSKKLVALDGAADDRFGTSVAVSGDLIVVGAPRDDDLGPQSGSAYVFERDAGGPGNWGQVAKLTAVDPLGNPNADDFGWEVALDGNTVLVTAPDELSLPNLVPNGATYLFERDRGGPNAWGVTRKFNTGSNDGLLSIAGDTASVRGRVHERNQGGVDKWGQVASVFPSGPVAISTDTLIAGSRFDNGVGQNSGAAFVYYRHLGGTDAWGQVATLHNSKPEWGDQFGNAVAVEGDAILIACHQDDEACPALPDCNSGSVFLFGRHTGGQDAWGEIAMITAPDAAQNGVFGKSLAMSGSTVFVGATSGIHVFEQAFPVAPTSYCTAGTTASGCNALISASGTPTLSQASGFDVAVTGSEGQKGGLIFFGTGGAQAGSWGNGASWRCVLPPVVRTGSQGGSGTSGACDGSFQLDLNAWMVANSARAPTAGSGVWMQAWFRDPANTSNQSTSLSNALSFVVCP